LGAASQRRWVVGVESVLRYGVLGLIIQRPIHAYGVFQELRKWPLEMAPTRSLVYVAVDRLAERHLIEDVSATANLALAVGSHVVERPLRKTHRVTDAGREEFEEWMASPLSSEQEIIWRIGAAQRSHLPGLVRLLRDTESGWYEKLAKEAAIELDRLGSAWTMSTKLGLMQVAKAKHFAARAAHSGELASLLKELDAETPRGDS
jgi:DNA-binding PadR family transcriptional regulator